MFDRASNSNLISTSSLSIFLLSFYLYQDFSSWPLIDFVNAQGPFLYVDTYTVLFYANCFSEIGNAVFAEGVTCARWTYGSGLLRVLNFTGVTQEHVNLIGHLFTYSIVCTFIYYLYLARTVKLAQIALFLGFISPPIWLIMERANFDTLIYLMVFVSAILFVKNLETLSILIILLSATFKFYTLPLLVIPFLLSKKFRTKLSSVLALFIGLCLILLDFSKMTGVIIQAGNNHFGMKIIGNYLGKIGISLNNYISYILGSFLFLICVVFVLHALRKREPVVLQMQLFPEPIKTIFIFMSSTFLLCFVVGLNVDYRLIFYITSAPYLMIFLRSNLRYIVFGIFIIGCWLCYPFGIFQTIGDFALELVAALQLMVTLYALFLRKKDLSSITT